MVGRVAVIAASAATLAFASASAASTVTIADALDKAFTDSVTPIILEDNDTNKLQDNDLDGGPSVGDFVYGLFQIQAIDGSGGSVPPNSIRVANNTPENGAHRTILGDGAGDVHSLTGILGARVRSVLTRSGDTASGGTTVGNPDSIVVLEPLDGSDTNLDGGVDATEAAGGAGMVWRIPDGLGGFVDYTKQGPASLTILEMYEDGASLAATAANLGSVASGVATFTDGSLLATAGFSMAAVDGANGAGEFFYNRDAIGSDSFPDIFESSMTILSVGAGGGLLALASPNDLAGPTDAPVFGLPLNFGMGATLYTTGTFAPPSIGSPWDAFSDANSSILVVPLPMAAWPALAVLAALGVGRIARINRVTKDTSDYVQEA